MDADLYKLIDSLDFKKLILFVERIKDKEQLDKMLSVKHPSAFEIRHIGTVRNLNVIQYLIAKCLFAVELGIKPKQFLSNTGGTIDYKAKKGDTPLIFKKTFLNADVAKKNENDGLFSHERSQIHIDGNSDADDIRSRIIDMVDQDKVGSYCINDSKNIDFSQNTNPGPYIQYHNTRRYKAQGFQEYNGQDEYKLFLNFLIKKIPRTLFKDRDSKGNTALHYSAVLGCYDTTKYILEECNYIVENYLGAYAHSYCENERVKNMLLNWTRTKDTFVDRWKLMGAANKLYGNTSTCPEPQETCDTGLSDLKTSDRKNNSRFNDPHNFNNEKQIEMGSYFKDNRDLVSIQKEFHDSAFEETLFDDSNNEFNYESGCEKKGIGFSESDAIVLNVDKSSNKLKSNYNSHNNMENRYQSHRINTLPKHLNKLDFNESHPEMSPSFSEEDVLNSSNNIIYEERPLLQKSKSDKISFSEQTCRVETDFWNSDTPMLTVDDLDHYVTYRDSIERSNIQAYNDQDNYVRTCVINTKNDRKIFLNSKSPQIKQIQRYSTGNIVENREISKFPGNVYLHLGCIIGYFSERADVVALKCKVFVDDNIIETKTFRPQSQIDINEMLIFKIHELPKRVYIFLLAQFDPCKKTPNFVSQKKFRKILRTSINIDDSFHQKIHNNLVSKDLYWKKYKTCSLSKALQDMFGMNLPDATLINTHFSYISLQEFPYFKLSMPKKMDTLALWLRYRKNSFNKWFIGYANVRGNLSGIATHLWKRRLVQWIGYTIFLYNETTCACLGSFDITPASYILCDDCTDSSTVKNSFKLILNDNTVEMQFDDKESYEVSKKALEYCIG